MAGDSFKELAPHRMSALPELSVRAMFGARALYSCENFLGNPDKRRLFFKTDAHSPMDSTSRGMRPFTYEMKAEVMAIAYHELAPDVLENARPLVSRTQRAIEPAASSRKSVKRPSKR